MCGNYIGGLPEKTAFQKNCQRISAAVCAFDVSEKNLQGTRSLQVFCVLLCLLSLEHVLADAAELADEIFRQVFPLDAFFLFVIDPTANGANVFHL